MDSQDKEPSNIKKYQARNFTVLAVHQIVMRIGGIFKTESIVMPSFLDSIGGGDVLRGFLPMLNRFGASVTPVLFARRLKHMPRKRLAMAVLTCGMSVPFLSLAGLWFFGMGLGEKPAIWQPIVFLVLYGAFFAIVGMNQLAAQTAQGKLIRPNLRGRLMTASIAVGAPVAIGVAWLLLPGWLDRPEGFGFIFLFTSGMFLLAAMIALLLREPPDAFPNEDHNGFAEHFRSAWRVLCVDVMFRRVAIVAALYSISLTMTPHYQAYGGEQLGVGLLALLPAILSQNAGAALFSLLAGPLADHSGNRVALHLTIFGAATTPLLAILLGTLGNEWGGQWFWLLYLPIGLTPVTFRLLMNYALELAPPAEHSHYVSTLGLCFAIPVMVGAVPVGWLIKTVGFEAVFLVGATVVGIAGLLTFWLVEPRHRQPDLAAVSDSEDVV